MVVADVAVTLVKLIFNLVVAIRGASRKAKRNKKECGDIAEQASSLEASLSSLIDDDGVAAPRHPAVISALNKLRDTLQQALQAVTKLEVDGDNASRVKAGNVSHDLAKLSQSIRDRKQDLILATNMHTNSILLGAQQSKRRGDGGLLQCPPPQIQEGCVANSYKEGEPAATSSGIKKFSLSELEAATKNFSEENLIEESDSCTVYKGELRDGSKVAIKAYGEMQYEACRKECENEEYITGKLLHKNILELVGSCSSGGLFYQVYEYMHNRSLSDHLHGSKIQWPKIFNTIIQGIARGVDYLHEQCGLGIVHLHLKPSSIQLDHDYTPKICDFGISKMLADSAKERIVDTIIGTWGFMAPEYMLSRRFSIKSDVYSFGVILLELISGWSRHEEVKNSKDPVNELVWGYWKKGELDECVDPRLSGATGVTESQIEEMKRCIHVALLCVEEDPELRPDMSDVLWMLRDNSPIAGRRSPRRPAYTT
ncbi:hypothetical protein BRADI_4g10590v3 [Brachypodium distachyon]|uniref:non-specific serine/threonine protein kinase n=1 Tax=Brachypodium distachyon TaxID=15368 RepID=I1IJJ6_BRADI|nr:hypothetical protein BRADI_4g10590v3 [Brachypodium distachyon]PNT63031.1 hypothetical protein BRADI_4g10590v3 [Brachypodium distachyon]